MDLVPTTFQQPYGRTMTFFFPQLAAFSESEASESMVPNFRAQWITDDSHSSFAIARMIVDGGTPVPEVYHPGELPASEVFTNPIMYTFRRTLAETQHADQFAAHPVRDLLLRGVHLINTRFVVATTRSAVDGFVMEVDASPIVAAPRMVPFEAEPVTAKDMSSELGRMLELESLAPPLQMRIKNGLRMVETMGLDPQRNSCERVLLRDGAESVDLGTSPEVEVLEHEVGHHRVRLRVHMTEPGFVRLAYAYFPFLRIAVDGATVAAIETADRFIALPLAAGEREITIEAHLSPLRLTLLWLAFGTLVVVGFFAVRERRLNPAR
jgi:hypothetical protein